MPQNRNKEQLLIPGFVTGAVVDDLSRSSPVSMRIEALKFLATERTDRKGAASAAIPSLFSRSQRLMQQALRTIRSLGVCPDNVERALIHLFDMIENGEIPCLQNPTQLKHAAPYYRSQIATTLAAIKGKSEQALAVYQDVISRQQRGEKGYDRAAAVILGER